MSLRSNSARVVAVALSISLVASFAPRIASADEPSAMQMETARTLYKEGLALRKEGDHRGALEKLKGANSLIHTPVTGIEVAREQVTLGLLVEAREECLQIESLPVSAKETKASTDARAEAQTLAGDLKGRIPTVKLAINGLLPGDHAVVDVDGTKIAEVALSVPISLDPGHHVINVANGDEPAQRTELDLVESERREVTVTLKPKSQSTSEPPKPIEPKATPAIVTPPPTITTPPPTTKTTSGSHGVSPLVYVGFVVAGVGIGVGSVTGILALSKASTVKNECPNAPSCPASASGDLDSVKSMATLSTISFALAGAGAVVGVIGLLSGGSSESSKDSARENKAHFTPWVSVGAVGLSGAF